MAVVVVLLWVVCAVGAGLFAQAKGRSVGWFTLAGIAFGVFGLIWAGFARPADRLSRAELRREQEIDQAHLNAKKQQRQPRNTAPLRRWPD